MLEGIWNFFKGKGPNYNSLGTFSYFNRGERPPEGCELEHTPELTKAAEEFFHTLRLISDDRLTLEEQAEAFKKEVIQHKKHMAFMISKSRITGTEYTPANMSKYDCERAQYLVDLIDDLKEVEKGPRKRLKLKANTLRCLVDHAALVPVDSPWQKDDSDEKVRAYRGYGEASAAPAYGPTWKRLYEIVTDSDTPLSKEIDYQIKRALYSQDALDADGTAEFLEKYEDRIAIDKERNVATTQKNKPAPPPAPKPDKARDDVTINKKPEPAHPPRPPLVKPVEQKKTPGQMLEDVEEHLTKKTLKAWQWVRRDEASGKMLPITVNEALAEPDRVFLSTLSALPNASALEQKLHSYAKDQASLPPDGGLPGEGDSRPARLPLAWVQANIDALLKITEHLDKVGTGKQGVSVVRKAR